MQVSPATFHFFLNSKNFPITFVSIWSSKVSHTYFLGILNSLQLDRQEKRANRLEAKSNTKCIHSNITYRLHKQRKQSLYNHTYTWHAYIQMLLCNFT